MSGRRTAERAKLEGAMMPRSYSPPPAGKRCAVCLLPLGDCTTRTCAHPAGREHAASEVEAVHAKPARTRSPLTLALAGSVRMVAPSAHGASEVQVVGGGPVGESRRGRGLSVTRPGLPIPLALWERAS